MSAAEYENPGGLRPLLGGGAALALEVEAERVAGCRLGSKLGEGGQGEVWVAVQEKTERTVALKFLKIPAQVPERERWTWLKDFQQEAKTLGALNHAGLVRLLDFVDSERGPCLVMEMVQGARLDVWLGNDPPGLRAKVALLEKVARALAEAHAQGVVHRDLKPANILVRPSGEPVVVDFGLAGPVESLPDVEAAQRCSGGTPGYMAPEQGRMRPTAKMDIHALGAVLFEALCGELPGHGDSTAQMIRLSVMSEEVISAPSARRLRAVVPAMPRELDAICARALAAAPADRYSAMSELAEDLRRWLHHDPLAAATMRTPWPRRLELAMRRRPWTWGLSTAAALALAGVALWMSHLAGEREAALALSRRTEAASLAAVAADAAARGATDEAMPWLERALALDPDNEVAGWITEQIQLDERPLVQVAGVSFADVFHAAGPPAPHCVRDGAFALRREDGRIYRCRIIEDTVLRLAVAPWPENAPPLPRCDALVLSPDESCLVAAFVDGSVRAYAVGSGALLWEHAGAPATEQCVFCSVSGKVTVQSSITVKKGNSSTVLRVFSLADGRPVCAEVTLPVNIPGQCLAVTADDRWLVTGSVNSTVWLGCTSLADGSTRDVTKEWARKDTGSGQVHALYSLPGGARVLVGGQRRGSSVLCLDAETGKTVWDRPVLDPPRDYTVSVVQVNVVPGGETFAVTGSEGNAMLHRVNDDKAPGVPLTLSGHNKLARFYDDEEVALVTKGTTIWNWKTGRRVARHASLDLHPCGRGRFLSMVDGQIGLWLMKGREPLRAEFNPGSGKTALELDAAKRRLLIAGAAGAAEVVNLETMLRIGPELRHGAPAEAKHRRMIARPRLSTDGSTLVVWEDARTVAVYAAGEDAARLTCKRSTAIRCAALSPDGRVLALATEDAVWEAWNVPEQRQLHRSTALCESPHGPGLATCMEFSADGARLAIGTDGWCTLSLWSTTKWGEAVQPPLVQAHGMADLCFVPDTANALWATDWLGQCRRYDAPPYYTLVGLPVVSVYAPVPDCAVSPDGEWLALASWNRTATVFHQRESTPQPQVLQHTGEVTSVDWSPDGRRLLTASAAGEVYVWDRVTGRRMFSWPQEAGVVQAAFALRGSRIVIARMDGVVRVREVYAGGGALPENVPALLEELSGYRIGDEGQQIALKPRDH